jgi:hypothetical protein
MASSSAPEQVPRHGSIAQMMASSSPIRHDPESANAVDLLSQAPKRVETGSQDLLTSRVSTEHYSSLSQEEVERKKRELEEQLNRDQRLPREPYTRHRADVSDSHPNGPWARKIILSLGRP